VKRTKAVMEFPSFYASNSIDLIMHDE